MKRSLKYETVTQHFIISSKMSNVIEIAPIYFWSLKLLLTSQEYVDYSLAI